MSRKSCATSSRRSISASRATFRPPLPRRCSVAKILRDQLKAIDFRVSSDFSPAVAKALQRGEIDLGFSRGEPQPDVTYAVIASEPIVATRSSPAPGSGVGSR